MREMMELKTVLRPGVQLIEYDHPDALFSYYGNPHYQTFSGEAFPIDEFLTYASKPRLKKDILQRFSVYKGFSKNLESLIAEDFFVSGEFKQARSKPDAFSYFCSNFYHDLDASEEALKLASAQQICIVDHLGIAQQLAEPFAALKMKRFKVAKSPADFVDEKSDFLLVLSSWQNVHQLNSLNRWCLENKREYFLVLFDMFGGSIGPVLGRKHGPCFTCLMTRRNSNTAASRRTSIERLEKWAADQERVEIGLFPPFTEILLRLAAMEVFKRFTGIGDTHGFFGLKEVDLLNIRTEYHEILPTPRCPMCFPAQNLAL
jgi:bacteriocin biosynthesis cyclodehydratase domain-containing protein